MQDNNLGMRAVLERIVRKKVVIYRKKVGINRNQVGFVRKNLGIVYIQEESFLN